MRSRLSEEHKKKISQSLLGKYTNKVTVTCDTCGKKFKKKFSQANKTNHHYCSKECNITLYREGHIPYNVSPKEETRGYKYIFCTFCHTPTKVALRDIKRYKTHFCDKVCAGKYKVKNEIGIFEPW